MKVHERVMVVARAEIEFFQAYREQTKHMDVYDEDIINGFAQSIINLSKEEQEKIILDEYHAKLEEALSKVVEKFQLTYAEAVGMLTNDITSKLKYLIRYERHGNTETPGGLE